jgi:uncharacterized membrane protein
VHERRRGPQGDVEARGRSGTDRPRATGRPAAAPRDEREPIVLGLLAAPGPAYDVAMGLARDLPDVLVRRFPGFRWEVRLATELMAAASGDDVDLVEIARRRMQEEGWKLAICLTDFPIHIGNRPVTAYASASSGVGLVSVPALGAVNLDDRVREAVLNLIEGLLGENIERSDDDGDERRHERMLRRLEDLASPVGRAEVREDRSSVSFMTAVGRGNLRLMVGMVRTNRPWRLVAGLSHAIVGALGLDIFGVASPGIWLIADDLDWLRLLVFGIGAIAVISVSLITVHGLWERSYSDRPEARERVIMFNAATTATVAIGVLTLYLILFLINVLASLLLISSGVLAKQVGHPVGFAEYLALAWLVSSLATLGGALGAALENDRAVREAAYGYQRAEYAQSDGASG